MKIERVRIENFRSIKTLDFEPGPYCVLIGENNSGKSNILRALNLALGETWPSERSFSEEDFYKQDTALKIPFVVLADHDIKAIDPSWSAQRQDKERERNAKHKRWNGDIETTSPADGIFWMIPDFETECGLPHAEAEKIDRAMERFSAAAATDVPDVLRPVIAKVVELAR